MTFDEVANGVAEAERTFNVVDIMASRLARMLVGRLRKVDSTYTLQQLKKELRCFNAHTGRWSE